MIQPMRTAQWYDFGTNEEGVITYRVNGEKHDLQEIIQQAKDLGFKFWEPPVITQSYKHWSVLLKLFIPRGYDQ